MTASCPAAIGIRSARIDDAGAIARLNTTLGYEASEATICERLIIFAESADHRVAVARLGDDPGVVGWIAAEQRLILESGPRVDITGLVVSSSARAKGVGTQLVFDIQRWAASLRFARLRVACNLKRSAAQTFYRCIGFDRIKEQAVYEKDIWR